MNGEIDPPSSYNCSYQFIYTMKNMLEFQRVGSSIKPVSNVQQSNAIFSLFKKYLIINKELIIITVYNHIPIPFQHLLP